MSSGLLTMLLLLMQPAADPAWFGVNSPQCVARRALHGQLLPLLVASPLPVCPWNSDEAALMEVGRQYSTYSWWNFDRTNNLENAAARVDGTMLLPGETFSYNETVGERSEANGYKEAKVMAEYGYTDGVGGGVCQPASNLHAAAFHAGLDIVERWPHRFRVKYVPAGLDATVDFGRKDLQIRNNTPYPVVFQMSRLERGELLTRVFAPAQTYRVRYKYELLSERPSDTVRFTVEERVTDPVEFIGRPGFELKKLIFRRNLLTGQVKQIRVRNDIYEPSPWSLRVTARPEGKSVMSGLTAARIDQLLKGTGHTSARATFGDLALLEKQWIRQSSVPRAKLLTAERYSELQPVVALAALAGSE